MTLITKPDFTYVWASGGAVVAPNDSKKQLGWVAEAPPFQYDNWLQNRQDQMLAHINQRGIPAWDALTNYEAGSLSYVQGSDGKIYKSVAVSGPTTTVQDPTTDLTDTYWTEAFSPIVSPAFSGNPTAPTAAQFDNDTSIATTAFVKNELLGQGNATYAAIFGSSLATNGYQKLPSGLIIQWGSNAGSTVAVLGNRTDTYSFPIAFPTAVLLVSGNAQSNGGSFVSGWVRPPLTTLAGCGVSVHNDSGTGDGPQVIGSNYIAIGY